MSDTIRGISDQLSNIFRHMLPGIFIIGAARLAFPSWFQAIILTNSWHILWLLVVATVVGNVWYILHRYTLHQFFDFAFYIYRERRLSGYLTWLSEFIYDSFRFQSNMKKMGNFLHLRSSQIILIFIVSEVIFTFSIWHEPISFFTNNKYLLFFISVLLFILAILQFIISITLDINSVTKWNRNLGP